MDKDTLIQQAFTMPFESPPYPKGPYVAENVEFFVFIYDSDPEAVRRVVPEPLEMQSPTVKLQFVRLPYSTGFGEYIEVSQLIPVTYEWEEGTYVHAMYTNSLGSIISGREIWGFPKKFGKAKLTIKNDVLTGTLQYGGVRIATGTMAYRYEQLSKEICLKTLEAPNFLLKILPHVNGAPRICELVRFYLKDINVKDVWTGPSSLELHAHAVAPVADFPINRIRKSLYILADLELPYGEVVYNYMNE